MVVTGCEERKRGRGKGKCGGSILLGICDTPFMALIFISREHLSLRVDFLSLFAVSWAF